MLGFRAALVTALLCAGLSSHASAQTYPTKPIKLIVPFGAGGPVDVMARLMAQKLSVSLGAIVVENRPGQGGTLGARAVAAAEPDGYTLMVATSTTMGVSANLYKNLDFDPVKSFAPIALISSVPVVLVVRPSLPIKSCAGMGYAAVGTLHGDALLDDHRFHEVRVPGRCDGYADAAGPPMPRAACAAASRASGTRYGEQET